MSPHALCPDVTNVGRWMHEELMRSALALAALGRGSTSPNPMVGCVVANEEGILGRGWHEAAGLPHAEPQALREAGPKANGATLYVNLEPCGHHGRTPPCTLSIIESGIRRVVIAMLDPDPAVNGRGAAALRQAGIEVVEGVLEQDARTLNEAYISHRGRGRPFVIYKAAISLDGKTSARDGTSKWITSAEARRDAQRLRSECDAICVGAGTVRTDDPALTVRDVQVTKHPLRVVIGSIDRCLPSSRVFSGEVPTIVYGVEETAPPWFDDSRSERVVVEDSEGKPSLQVVLADLASRGVMSVLLEGGPTIAGSFQRQGLIDRYVFYVAPKLLGDDGGGAFGQWSAGSISEALNLRFTGDHRIGPDIRLDAYPAETA